MAEKDASGPVVAESRLQIQKVNHDVSPRVLRVWEVFEYEYHAETLRVTFSTRFAIESRQCCLVEGPAGKMASKSIPRIHASPVAPITIEKERIEKLLT